jgi:hypothetical protein
MGEDLKILNLTLSVRLPASMCQDSLWEPHCPWVYGDGHWGVFKLAWLAIAVAHELD